MRKFSRYTGILMLLAMVSCTLVERHDDIFITGEKTPSVPEINIVEPSPEICEANVFQVDYLTALDDYPYLVGRNLENIRRHIVNQEGKPSVLYMVDRMDFQVGKSQPLVRLAKEVSCHPFFAQSGTTCLDIIPGTGILSTVPIRDYDGLVLDGEVFLSGCKMMLPLAVTDEVAFYTAAITSLEQAKDVLDARKNVFYTNGILVGKVRREIADDFGEFVRSLEGMRLELVQVRSADYAFYIMTPMNFVCRKIHKGTSRGRIDHFRITLEKIS